MGAEAMPRRRQGRRPVDRRHGAWSGQACIAFKRGTTFPYSRSPPADRDILRATG